MKKYQDRLKFSLLNSFVMYMYASHKMHQAWITVAILKLLEMEKRMH